MIASYEGTLGDVESEGKADSLEHIHGLVLKRNRLIGGRPSENTEMVFTHTGGAIRGDGAVLEQGKDGPASRAR